MVEISDYKTALITAAEREAEIFLKTGKIGGELDEAVQAIMQDDGIYKIVAMLLTYAHKGDMRSVMEEYGFSDWRVEREINKSASIQYQNVVDIRRYEMGA